MTEYSRNGSVRCEIRVRDENGNLTDPTSMSLIIYNPDDVVSITKAIGDFTRESVGIYYYIHSIAANAEFGDWKYEFTPTNAGGESNVVASFFVVSASYPARYCSVADVARFMGGITISSSSTPSIDDVTDIINMHEDEIDQYTHHAWRPVLIENEHYNFDGFVAQLERFGDWSDRARLYLKHRNIRNFTSGTHKIEIWDGQSWVDFVVNYEEGRGSDWWMDYDRGILHFSNRYPWRMRHSVRLTYEYGDKVVHGDIKKACIMLTAAYLLQGEDYSVLLPEGTSNIPIADKSVKWTDTAYKLLDKHVELTTW